MSLSSAPTAGFSDGTSSLGGAALGSSRLASPLGPLHAEEKKRRRASKDSFVNRPLIFFIEVNIPTIEFTVLAIFNCTVQWH